MGSTDRPRLVAGTSAGEREPPDHPRPVRDWHLPPHAREPEAVRGRHAAQVAAGADVILAQTYLTHRRALARVGEARRARELTTAAVAVARSAVDEGLERRRAEERTLPERVLIAGVIPPLADVAETATGRLLPSAASIEQDLETQAGILAESGVDLILVEPGASPTDAAGAAAVRSVGLPAWVVVSAQASWIRDEVLNLDPAALLLSGEPTDAEVAALTGTGGRGSDAGETPVGIWLIRPPPAPTLGDMARGWLSAGASMFALADEATPERIGVVASAIDEAVEAERVSREEATGAWRAWVRAGSEMAPGGRAAWIGGPAQEAPPDGWAWDVVAAEETPRLPASRYRLAVTAGPETAVAIDSMGHILEPGGIAVAATGEPLRRVERLRIVDQRSVDGRRWLICRREDR
jgi:hypothetical protein